MQKLQYAALRKCTRAVVGARMESVNKIAAVESMKTHMDAMQVRFIVRAIGDPEGVGDLVVGDEERTPRILGANIMVKAIAVVEGQRLEWGGRCSKLNVVIVDLEAGRESTIEEWEAVIKKAT